MSIFESGPQMLWRMTREGSGKFLGKIDEWLKRMGAEFRALPRVARTAVYIGGSMLVVLLVFAFAVWPMLQRPEPALEPEGSRRETVADAVERLDNWTQGNVTPEDVPVLMEDINEQAERTEKNQELARLYILKFKVFFNAGQYYDAAMIGNEAIEIGVIEQNELMGVYAMLVSAYGMIGDHGQRQYYAKLIVDAYESGAFDDIGGSMPYYTAIANGDIE
jgi:hypothetical protein